MKLFKKLRCEHEYQEIYQYDDYSYDYELCLHTKSKKIKLYCPKCKKIKRMYLSEWETEQKIKEIDEKFKESR